MKEIEEEELIKEELELQRSKMWRIWELEYEELEREFERN
jgi:hypothetical protein